MNQNSNFFIMKSPLLMLLLMIAFPIVVSSQEIKIAASVLPAGGNVESENQITLSKWRIGVVHQLEFKDLKSETKQINDWLISAYPNPVGDLLNLRFSIQQKEDFTIEVSDILGKILLTKIIHQVNMGDVIQMDLSTLKTGLYMVKIWNSDKPFFSILKIIKN